VAQNLKFEVKNKTVVVTDEGNNIVAAGSPASVSMELKDVMYGMVNEVSLKEAL
jgi:hypothetical protein